MKYGAGEDRAGEFQAAHYELRPATVPKRDAIRRRYSAERELSYCRCLRPDDMMMAMNAMHRRYWFTDVTGELILLNYFERRGFALDITDEDKAVWSVALIILA